MSKFRLNIEILFIYFIGIYWDFFRIIDLIIKAISSIHFNLFHSDGIYKCRYYVRGTININKENEKNVQMFKED